MPMIAKPPMERSAAFQPKCLLMSAMPSPETVVAAYPMMPMKPFAIAAASFVACCAATMPISACGP